MWPGHRAHCLNVPVEAMKTYAKGVYMVQEFAVNNIVCFYSSESRFAIHDDPGAGLQSMVCDSKMVTLQRHTPTYKLQAGLLY